MKGRNAFIAGGIIALLAIVLLSSMANKKKQEYSNLVYIDQVTLQTSYKINDASMQLYIQLEKLKAKDEAGIRTVYANFQRVQESKRDLVSYIQNLRGLLIADADGIASSVGDTLRLTLIQNPDNVSSVNKIMLGAGAGGGAAQLKLKFKELETGINKLPAYVHGRKVHILCEECLQMSTGNQGSWEMIVFHDRKLIDVLLTLDSVCLQLATTENDALHSYLDVRQ